MQSSVTRELSSARLVCKGQVIGSSQRSKALPAKVHSSLSSRVSIGSRPMTQVVRMSITASVPQTRGTPLVTIAGVPTVSDTKAKFINAYTRPIPAVFNTVIQELLVSQHLSRYNTKYSYNPTLALGFCSVFDQIFAEYKYGNAEEIFSAFIKALDEDPATYRSDTKALTDAAAAASSADELCELDAVKAIKGAADTVFHNKFTAIGLFRILEVAGKTDAAALDKLVTSSGMDMTLVNRDLMTYKGLLTKLDSAKELEKEILERERKMTAERLAEKEKKTKETVEAKAEKTEENIDGPVASA